MLESQDDCVPSIQGRVRSIQPLPLSPHRTKACFDARGEAALLRCKVSFYSTRVLLSPLYTAGSDGIPITSHGLVLTSSLVIATDQIAIRLFPAADWIEQRWDSSGLLFPKTRSKEQVLCLLWIHKQKYALSKGSFSTPKQELTLLERDFLLVLCLGAQIGI